MSRKFRPKCLPPTPARSPRRPSSAWSDPRRGTRPACRGSVHRRRPLPARQCRGQQQAEDKGRQSCTLGIHAGKVAVAERTAKWPLRPTAAAAAIGLCSAHHECATWHAHLAMSHPAERSRRRAKPTTRRPSAARARRRASTTRPMFGSVAAFANGYMFMGLFAPELFVRLPDDERAAQMAAGWHQLEPMPGKPMRDTCRCPATGGSSRTRRCMGRAGARLRARAAEEVAASSRHFRRPQAARSKQSSATEPCTSLCARVSTRLLRFAGDVCAAVQLLHAVDTPGLVRSAWQFGVHSASIAQEQTDSRSSVGLGPHRLKLKTANWPKAPLRPGTAELTGARVDHRAPVSCLGLLLHEVETARRVRHAGGREPVVDRRGWVGPGCP